MPTTTTNYSLLKPLVNNATDQDLWGGYLNDDMDDIDGLLRAGITAFNESSKTTDFSVDSSISVKKLYPCDATSGNIIATVPLAATAGNGSIFFLVKTDSSTNTIAATRTSSDTINGENNYVLNSQYQCVEFVSDGVSAWRILSQSQSSAFRVKKTQVFSSSGTYTPSAGMLYCDLEAWGAGGGGGGSNINVGAAGGGGAGGYSIKTVASSIIGASQIITIGAAGTAGSGSNGTGGTGGTTSIGSIIQATGGAGGTATNGSSVGAIGGLGGIGSSGDKNLTGNPGSVGTWGGNTLNASGGIGGTTTLSGSGAGGVGAPSVGNAASANSGSGGGGACSNGTPQAGGAGGSGYVVITEYCSQ